jgi:GT2 family glycosyltransferase
MRIVLVLVNYYCERDIAETVRSFEKQEFDEPIELAIYVVDNGSTGADLDRNLINSNVDIVRPGENLGYMPAANLVLNSLEMDGNFEWLILSNPDIRLPDPLMLQRLNAFSQYLVIAPSIVDSDGRDQNPFLTTRPSQSTIRLRKIIFSRAWIWYMWWKWRSLVPKHRPVSMPAANNPVQAVYAGHGSFMVFHHEYFAKGGTMSHPLQLYGEEFFVAESVRRMGSSVRYIPSLTVEHIGHSTTSPSLTIARHMRLAARYVADVLFANG